MLQDNFISRLFFILMTFLVITVTSCEKDKDNTDFNGNDSIPIDNVIDTLTGLGHEESGDYSWDPQSEIVINLQGSSISSSSPDVLVSGTIATIRKSGNYKINGLLNSGAIIVDASKNDLVRLILDNVNIHNPTGPAILIEKARKVIVHLPEGSENQLSDGSVYYNHEDPNATLFSKSDLTLYGTGKLTVNANFNDGITGKDGLIIKSGIYNVNAIDDGIRGKDYLIIQQADISVVTGGDGFKSDEETNPKPGNIVFTESKINAITGGDGISAEGSIAINKGYYSIISGGGYETDTSSLSQKGIKAGNLVVLSPDSVTIDATDHAIDTDGSAEIRSGKFVLYTARTGVHTNKDIVVSGGSINILRSVEGFESNRMFISQAEIRITSIDDCFSATAGYDVDYDDGSLVEINSGYLVLDCINGDGIDSNGDLTIAGGTIIIHGPHSAPEVTIDPNGKFNINGGTIIGSGTNSDLIEFPDTTSHQNSLLAIFSNEYPKGTIIHLTNSKDDNIVTFKPSDEFQSIIFSSPGLVEGEIYRIFVEGSVEGNEKDGLFDGIYTQGVLITEFTLTGKVTVLSNLS